jgi:hypothetical protein
MLILNKAMKVIGCTKDKKETFCSKCFASDSCFLQGIFIKRKLVNQTTRKGGKIEKDFQIRQ